MAASLTKWGRKARLDHEFGVTEDTFPTGVWLALFRSDPTDEGLQTSEVTGTGYARVNIITLMGEADLDAGEIVNALEIAFPNPGSDWGEWAYFGIMTAATIGTGNMRYFGAAVTSRVIVEDDPLLIEPGQLIVRLT